MVATSNAGAGCASVAAVEQTTSTADSDVIKIRRIDFAE
jgi:hypothetical protein